ncbi:MAG: Uma2 family endonuclease [Deltaproteobacteria bacterium]|nr:Uma2 family endonuclease [Deltaproteobacteria bacterium]
MDERLVMPETRYEVVNGVVQYVSPANESHGESHADIATLLKTHAAKNYKVAVDMLTRSSEVNDFAPDASVYPAERDPKTGGRQLEELAFEVLSTTRLADAGEKAKVLTHRGVRRVFAVDVKKKCALEWIRGAWQVLAQDGVIRDRALAAPLSVAALVSATETDDAVADALFIKGNRIALSRVDDARLEAQTQAILGVLEGRGIPVSAADRERILSCRDAKKLSSWIRKSGTVASATELLGRARARRAKA